MDDPNINMEQYIQLEEEKARRHALSCEPTVSPLNDNQIDFRTSFDEFDDEDYTVIYDRNSFSYKIIYVDDLKTDSENDYDKVNTPSFPSSALVVSYFNDFDYFKDFEKEFPAITYNDALTSKLDFLPEPTDSTFLGLRKKYRLSIKNDMSPQAKDLLKVKDHQVVSDPFGELCLRRLLFHITLSFPWIHKEVIINGDSLIPSVVVEGAAAPAIILTVEQKLARRNELKARGTLLMALPDKHQLKFNSYKDAKTLMHAIKKRFGGNTETKKVQKTLLKQQFENFTCSSSEDLDQIHDRLQKLVSQLEIHGVSLFQEDVNLKFLRSLPSEWKTHTLIWRNKANLEEHSLDDFFNSLKIYETEVRHSSPPINPTQNLAFVSSSNTDSTTDSVGAATSVSAVCAKLLVSSHPNIDSLKIDLRWQMTMLTMGAKRFLYKTGRNLGDNRATTMGFDMSKVECYNCHRKGHFARECRFPKDTRRTVVTEPQRRHVPVETSTSNALVSQCDGIGSYDWSYQAEEEPANFALMAISSTSSFDNELSPAKPAQPRSHTTKSMAPIIEDWVSDSEDESEPNDSQSAPSFVQPSEHVKLSGHSVQPVRAPILDDTPKPTSLKTNGSRKRKNRKTCFVCRGVDHLIKDCNFHTKPKSQPTPRNSAYRAVKPVSADIPKIMATKPRHTRSLHINPNLIIIRHKTHSNISKTSNSSPRVTVANAKIASVAKGKNRKWGNPQHTLKDKGVIDSGCSRHMIGNMSYLSDFQELNGGYVAFGGNPKGGKITGKGKIKTGKFEGKADEGFLVGYSMNSKAFRVFNNRTRIVQGTLHVNFLENKPNVAGTGPTWLFDIDSLTRTMNYQPVTAGNQSNFSNKEGHATFDGKEHDTEKPESVVNLSLSSSALSGEQDDITKKKDKGKSPVDYFTGNRDFNAVFNNFSKDSSNDVNAAGPIVPAAGHNYSNSTNPISDAGPSNSNSIPTHGQSSLRDNYLPPDMVERADIVYSDHETVGTEANFNNLETSITVSPIPTTRIHNAHPISQIIGNLSLTTQTRSIARIIRDQVGISQILNDDFHTYMFACFLSQEEPKRVHQALKDLSWIEAMQEELFQFKIQKFWILVDLPQRKRAIGTKWVYKNKKDERGIVVRNKARLVAQGHTQEEGIDYEEEEVYVCQPLGFEDPDKVYKVVKALYGFHQAPRAWGIHILSGSSVSTPIDIEKPLLKDPDGEDVDVHTYISMIGSLMYLTSSRPDIMFAVRACARFQVTPKVLHLHAVKRIFRYLKGKLYLGLWYPKDSPFDLVAYSDSDYAGASLDRKSTTGGCQFLGSRLISWQCKKQTVVATSSIEAEYVAGASYCA
nr:hypothetical protein [Tanacetum cinerariifolium]